MQGRHAGDIGDFGKIGLFKCFADSGIICRGELVASRTDGYREKRGWHILS